MSYKTILDSISDSIERVIEDITDATEIPTNDYGWKNKRYISDYFRIAHIERYSDRAIEVLHVTCFPNVTCGNPVFGFDVITTEKKPLAAFLDWSPIDNDVEYVSEIKFENKDYKLPDWAKTIFSKNAIAIIPQDENDLSTLKDIVLDSLEKYLTYLLDSSLKSDRTNKIVEKQNFYCDQQQKNERTMNVLKAKLGEDKAKEFMETILFPKIISH